MYSEKEILNALRVLQDVCKKSTGCEYCILRSSDKVCGVLFDTGGDPHTNLNNWNLIDENNPRIILN